MRSPKRWLRKVTDNTVWTWTESLEQRTDMVEISEEEALARINGDPIPNSVALAEKVDKDIIELIDNLSPQRKEQLRAFLGVANQEAALSAEDPILEVPGGLQTNTGEPQLKDDPEMKVEDINKPISQMTKGELDTYAQVKYGRHFDMKTLTKTELYQEVQKLENPGDSEEL